MTPRHAELAADIFTGLVVASVGVALAGLVWRIAGDGGGAALSPAGAVAPIAGPVDVQPIIALAPFGRVQGGGDAQLTGLPIQLKGILLAVPRSASTALIASGDKALSYGVGQQVAGATITEIAVDRVLLDVGGRREMLAFPKPAPAAGSAPAAPAVAPSPAVATPVPPPPLQAPAIAAAGQAVEGQGFRINGDPPAALLSAGIQPGDVIERVNGIDLGDPARARELLGGAALSGGARVDVLRNGRRFTVAVSR